MDENKEDNMRRITLRKPKKPWYKRIWLWIIVAIVLFAVIGASNQPNSNTPQQNTAPQDTTTTEWNVQDAYNKIENGMSKSQVEQATGKKSESCTESEDPTFGKTEVCTYGNAFINKSAIVVTYRQDKVESKSKSTY